MPSALWAVPEGATQARYNQLSQAKTNKPFPHHRALHPLPPPPSCFWNSPTRPSQRLACALPPSTPRPQSASPYRRRRVRRRRHSAAGGPASLDALAGLADSGTTLVAEATELLIGRIAFDVNGPAITATASRCRLTTSIPRTSRRWLASTPPTCLRTRRRVRLRTAARPSGCALRRGTHPMPRSRPMKRWSQGELDECRGKQAARAAAFLLGQGWIVPSRAAHASVVCASRTVRGASAGATAGSTPSESRSGRRSRCRAARRRPLAARHGRLGRDARRALLH